MFCVMIGYDSMGNAALMKQILTWWEDGTCLLARMALGWLLDVVIDGNTVISVRSVIVLVGNFGDKFTQSELLEGCRTRFINSKREAKLTVTLV